MDVNGIRDRVVELGHQASGDGDVQAKALGWINAAYHELMDDVVAYLPPGLQVLEEVTTDANGKAALGRVPYRVLRVVDKACGVQLDVVGQAVILDADPCGLAGGAPQRCTLAGAEISVHPAASGVVLRVLYLPVVDDLAEGGSEASLLLPKSHHHVLVWGGLVWSALFERGFGTQGELALYQRAWEQAKERVKLSLLSHTGEVLRVKPFDIV